MTRGFIVVGTDTGIGKTVFAAGLVGALDGVYWKPVQAGLEDETDSRTVTRLALLPPDRVQPEAYVLKLPASPHIAARREGLSIDRNRLSLPVVKRPLVVETAGGVLVPLTDELPQVAMVEAWARQGLGVIVCARTMLGTINHTLLTLEALRARSIAVAGVAFIGAPDDEAERSIADIGRVPRLGRLPWLDPLTPDTLRRAFDEHFGGANLGAWR